MFYERFFLQMLYFLLFGALLRLTDGLNVTSHRFRIQKHTKLTSGVTKIRDVFRRGKESFIYN